MTCFVHAFRNFIWLARTFREYGCCYFFRAGLSREMKRIELLNVFLYHMGNIPLCDLHGYIYTLYTHNYERSRYRM